MPRMIEVCTSSTDSVYLNVDHVVAVCRTGNRVRIETINAAIFFQPYTSEEAARQGLAEYVDELTEEEACP